MIGTYATDEQREALKALTTADLVSAYNGAHGCACGCRGRHSYMDAAGGTATRGYEVTPDEVSPRRVANTLRKIQQNASEAAYFDAVPGRAIWSLDTETRTYIVYVRDTATVATCDVCGESTDHNHPEQTEPDAATAAN